MGTVGAFIGYGLQVQGCGLKAVRGADVKGRPRCRFIGLYEMRSGVTSRVSNLWIRFAGFVARLSVNCWQLLLKCTHL